jgi:hypothetical protein
MAFLVTGNRHVLALGEYEGVRIVTPAEFLKIPAEPWPRPGSRWRAWDDVPGARFRDGISTARLGLPAFLFAVPFTKAVRPSPQRAGSPLPAPLVIPVHSPSRQGYTWPGTTSLDDSDPVQVGLLFAGERGLLTRMLDSASGPFPELPFLRGCLLQCGDPGIG